MERYEVRGKVRFVVEKGKVFVFEFFCINVVENVV